MDLDTASRSRPNTWPLKTKSVRSASFVGVSSICLVLAALLAQHRPNAYAQSNLWYTDRLPESRWISDWVMLAQHYHDNPTVIGADLHNEPHGEATWGSGVQATDWRLAAERGGNAILSVNPSWLIVVEGIEAYQNQYYWWGGNLMGTRQFPVRLR